jgi:hypothetical protein
MRRNFTSPSSPYRVRGGWITVFRLTDASRIHDSCRSNAFQAGPGMTEKQESGEKAISISCCNSLSVIRKYRNKGSLAVA